MDKSVEVLLRKNERLLKQKNYQRKEKQAWAIRAMHLELENKLLREALQEIVDLSNRSSVDEYMSYGRIANQALTYIAN